MKAPVLQEVDEETEAVPDQVLSDGYSASEPSVQVGDWENVGLDDVSDVEAQQMRSDQGGAVSPSILKAPVTPIAEIASGDEDVEIPSSSHKHLSSIPLTDNCAKMQTMDGGPVVAPKSKAARTDGGVKQVAEVETYQKCIRNIQRSP